MSCTSYTEQFKPIFLNLDIKICYSNEQVSQDNTNVYSWNNTPVFYIS